MNFAMLEFNKTRHSLYNNLDYLGLNPYEQKHFCFHGSTDGDESGGAAESEDTTGIDAVGPGPGPGPGQGTGVGGGRGGDPRDYGFDPEEAAEAARASSVKGFTEEEAAELADITDVRGLPSTLDLGSLANLDAYHEGFYDPVTGQTKTDKQYAMDILNELGRKGMTTTAQNMLDARAFTGLSIPEMNALERDYNLKTFGLGYRGPFEARSGKGQTRASYSPNALTGAGTDERSYNMAMFQSFAKANRGLTTVEAVAQHNAESPGLQVSINDVQSMGFDLNAPVGPQADFREAVAQRGLAQGIGLLAAGPISGMATIATDGKGMLGILSEVLGIEEEVEELGFGKIPSYQEVALDVFGPGPERDTMNPAGFGISPTTEETIGSEAFGLADISPPTNEEIGYTDMGMDSFTLDGNEEIIPLSPQIEPIIKEQEEIVATPSPRFPTIDTVPQSRVDRIASIYNISKEAAERMLGVTA